MKQSEQNAKKKTPQTSGSAVMICLMLLFGGAAGAFLAHNDRTADGAAPVVIVQAAILVAAGFVQVIAHEAGHMLFGLCTGYGFLSFRIGSVALQRDADGKLRFKRFSIAGTAGQCLMTPPEYRDGAYPYALYNLGGVIVNVVLSAAAIPFALRLQGLASFAFLALSVIGCIFAVSNGLPIRFGAIPNDGCNLRMLRREPAARRGMWLQLHIHALLTHGTRLRDMPQAWFDVPDDAQMHNSLAASLAVFGENRLMDMQDFAAARERIAQLTACDGVLPIYKNFLTLDRVYIDVLENGSQADISALQGKSMRAFLRSMRQNPAVLRTRYAAALLYAHDPQKAALIRAQFDKTVKRYPIEADAQLERELIALADQKNAP